MADIKGQITVNEIDIIEVDTPPGVSGGTPASVGSVAIEQDELNQEGRLWHKTGPLDIDWSQVVTIFGTEHQYDSSEDASTTTSNTYQQKLRLTTTNLPLGEYRIGWYCEGSNSGTSDRFQMRVQINDTDTLCEHSHESEDQRDRVSVSGHSYVENLSGIVNIDLDYREQQGGTALIQRARLEIWRVG